MRRRGDQAQVICAEENGIVALAGHDAVDDGEIQFIKPQHIINILYSIAHDLDAHIGMVIQIRGQHLRGQQVAGGGRDADGEALDPLEGIPERLPPPARKWPRTVGVFEQQGPVRRGLELAAALDENLDAVSSSSMRTWWLTAGWVSESACAARV